MLKFLLGEFPEWTNTHHPFLRYHLTRHPAPRHWAGRLLNRLTWIAILATLFLASAGAVTDGFQHGFELPYSLDFWKVCFYPLLLLQGILGLLGFVMGADEIAIERRQQTWDALRATEQGAELALNARWFGILFYRLRGLLGLNILVRVVLVGVSLYEMTSHEGRLLDQLFLKSVPSIPAELGLVFYASLLTAVLLLPLSSVALETALGLWWGTFAQRLSVATFGRIVYALARMAILLGVFFAWANLLNTQNNSPFALGIWAGFSAFVDLGLSYLPLSQVGLVWSAVPWSAYLTLALFAWALIQFALTAWLLRSATHASERGD